MWGDHSWGLGFQCGVSQEYGSCEIQLDGDAGLQGFDCA